MTMSDLPVEGLRAWPGTSDHQFDSAPAPQKPTDTGGAAAGPWTRASQVAALAT